MIGRGGAAVAIRQNRDTRGTQPGVPASASAQTVPRSQQIGPRRKKNRARRHRHPFIPQSLQKR